MVSPHEPPHQPAQNGREGGEASASMRPVGQGWSEELSVPIPAPLLMPVCLWESYSTSLSLTGLISLNKENAFLPAVSRAITSQE